MPKQSEKGCSECHQLFDLYETEYCQPCAKAFEKGQHNLVKLLLFVIVVSQAVWGCFTTWLLNSG